MWVNHQRVRSAQAVRDTVPPRDRQSRGRTEGRAVAEWSGQRLNSSTVWST